MFGDKIFRPVNDEGKSKTDYLGLVLTYGGIILMIKIAVSDGLFDGFIKLIGFFR